MAAADHLQAPRQHGLFLHHGIDLGDGTVVHARPRDFRWPFGGGSVVRTSIAEFADGEPYAHRIDLTTAGPYDGKPLP